MHTDLDRYLPEYEYQRSQAEIGKKHSEYLIHQEFQEFSKTKLANESLN